MPWLWDLLGWTLALAAVLLLAWSLFSDRARSRRRCGRCWYDMSATPGLKCPECGREHKAEPDLYKSRRRWRWAIVAVILLLGAYPAAHIGESRINGWPAFVPRTALIFLWPAIDRREFDRQQSSGIRSTTSTFNRLLPPQLWGWQRWLHGWECGRVLRNPKIDHLSYSALSHLGNLGKDMGPGRDAYLGAFLDPIRRQHFFPSNRGGFGRFFGLNAFQDHPADLAKILEAAKIDPALIGDDPNLLWGLDQAGVDIKPALPRINAAIDYESPERAADILGQLPPSLGQDTIDDLYRISLRRGGEPARTAIYRLFESDRDITAFIPLIVPCLEDLTPGCRKTAAMALAWIGPPAAEALPALKSAENDRDPAVQLAVKSAIAAISRHPDLVADKLVAAAGASLSAQYDAASLLGAVQPDPAVGIPALVKIVDSNTKNNMIRASAFRSIARYGPAAGDFAPWLAEIIIKDAGDTPDMILRPACDALFGMGSAARPFAAQIRASAASRLEPNRGVIINCADRLDAIPP